MGAMPNDETNAAITDTAVEALLQLNQHGRALCPEGAEPDAWASAVLYDLARVAELLDGAVAHVSGQRNDTVAQNSQALASVIAAHRNVQLGPRR